MISSLLSVVGLRSSPAAQEINVNLVEIHNIETSTEKRGRRLKHLLRLNHAKYSILYHNLRYHNHSPHLLGSAYLLGGSANNLNAIYEDILKHDNLERWEESPGEIDPRDYRDFLGKKNYQRAWVDFFEDRMIEKAFDWRTVAKKFLFESGSDASSPDHYPMFHCLTAGLGHPLIHLGYAYELNSREIAVEALGLAATCYNSQLAGLLHQAPPSDEEVKPTADLFAVFEAVRNDSRLDNLLPGPGGSNLDQLLSDPKLSSILLAHFHSWEIKDPTTQFSQSQHLASLLLVSTSPYLGGHGFDFFLVHLLNTSHAARILLPFFPIQHHVLLVKEWLLISLAVYIAQARPDLSAAKVALDKFNLNGRDWDFVTERALHSKHGVDAHYVKACRAMMSGANTWGDRNLWFLRCAVLFADEFNGWGGFGAGDEEAEEARRFLR